MSDLNMQDRLDDYLDGEMSAEERRDFEAKLARSDSLRQELEERRRASGRLREHFEEDADRAVDDEGCAIAVEQIVRMSTQELRRGTVAPPGRRSPLMIIVVALATLGLLIMIAKPFLGNEPSPDELVTKAAQDLESGVAEYRFGLNQQTDALVGAMQNVIGFGVDVDAVLRIGPRGLIHVRASSEAYPDYALQGGYDGRKFWMLQGKDGPVQRSADMADFPDDPVFKSALGAALHLRRALDEARKNPGALRMVGQVEDELGQAFWKVHLGGSQAPVSGDFWFDEEGRLQRFGFGPIVGNLNPNPDFGVEDFQLDRILPDMKIEELDE